MAKGDDPITCHFSVPESRMPFSTIRLSYIPRQGEQAVIRISNHALNSFSGNFFGEGNVEVKGMVYSVEHVHGVASEFITIILCPWKGQRQNG